MHWYYMNGWPGGDDAIAALSGWGGPGVIRLLFRLVFGILFLAVMALLVRLLWQRTQQPRQPAGESPMDILRRRYARGEVTKEQFEDMRRQIEGNG